VNGHGAVQLGGATWLRDQNNQRVAANVGMYRDQAGNPRLGPARLRTFAILAPTATHWRPASCAEAGCDRYRNGYEIRIDASSPDPLTVARLVYLRSRKHGVRMEEYRAERSDWVVFRVPPGERVFGHEGQHRIRVDRPELFAVHDPAAGTYLHRGRANGADDWQDQFANHQDQLATRVSQG